jgi:hypothetical protein
METILLILVGALIGGFLTALWYNNRYNLVKKVSDKLDKYKS